MLGQQRLEAGRLREAKISTFFGLSRLLETRQTLSLGDQELIQRVLLKDLEIKSMLKEVPEHQFWFRSGFARLARLLSDAMEKKNVLITTDLIPFLFASHIMDANGPEPQNLEEAMLVAFCRDRTAGTSEALIEFNGAVLETTINFPRFIGESPLHAGMKRTWRIPEICPQLREDGHIAIALSHYLRTISKPSEFVAVAELQ